jgi:hypothetical protein
MRITSARDLNGDEIRIGSRIETFDYKERFIAVIKGFEHYQGNVVRVVATREDDSTEVKTFSDAVVLRVS